MAKAKPKTPRAKPRSSPKPSSLAPRTKKNDPDHSRGSFVYMTQRVAGVRVTEDTALTLGAVWACVRCISESLAGLPWQVYRNRADGGRDPLRDHPINWILDTQPSPETPAFQFRETIIAHALTWGNGYAEIERDIAGRPVWLWLLTPDRVHPARDGNGRLVYEIQNPVGPPTYLEAEDMFHIRGLGYEGIKGYSVIQLAARSIGAGIALDQATADFFANDSTPGGYLSHPGRLGPQAKKNLESSWEMRHKGAYNRRRVAVLEEGLKWEQTGLPPEDTRLIEQRQFTPADIARWFRVPPHKIADLIRATFCLPAGETVLTEDGPQPIETIRPGTMVWSRGEDGIRLAPVVRSGCTGADPILTIKTTNRTLRCNAKHPVLVRRKKVVAGAGGFAHWESEYVPAGSLKEGDTVVCLSHLPDMGSLEACSTRVPTVGFMEFCGLLIGDGNVSSGFVSIARADHAPYMDYYREVMKSEFLADHDSGLRGERHHQAKLTEDQVREIRSLGSRVCSVSSIARRFGADISTVCRIARGGNYAPTHPQAALNEERLEELKEALRSRTTVRQIAKHYGVHSDTVKKILSGRLWGVKPDRKPLPIRLQEGVRSTRFSSRRATNELAELGLSGTARTKRVPGWVFRLPESHRLAFLRGFLDADGSCDKKGRLSFSSVNRFMLGQIRDLCISCGIPVTNLRTTEGRTRLPNGNLKDFVHHSFTCSDPGANRRIGSRTPSYVARMEAGQPFGRKDRNYPWHGGRGFDESGLSLARIVSIEQGAAEPVYDLTVEGTHSFIAEGVVVHNSNIEESNLDFVQDTLRPWAERLETEADIKLFGRSNRGTLQTILDMKELKRGNMAAQSEFVKTMVNWGIYSINEGRQFIDMNPIPDGEKRLVPVNMQLLEKAGEQPPASSGGSTVARTPEQMRSLAPVFEDTFRRIILRESQQTKEQPRNSEWLEKFMPDHRTYLSNTLRPLVASTALAANIDPTKLDAAFAVVIEWHLEQFRERAMAAGPWQVQADSVARDCMDRLAAAVEVVR